MLLIVLCDLISCLNNGDSMNANLINGKNIAKISNASRYDLWFPDGSFKYTREIKGSFLCNDKWYNAPFKPMEKEFNVVGFFLVLFWRFSLSLYFQHLSQ